MEEGGRREDQRDSVLLNVKVEEGAVSQEVWTTSRKGKEMNFPPRPLKGMLPCPHLNLSPVKLILDF